MFKKKKKKDLKLSSFFFILAILTHLISQDELGFF